MKHKVLWIDDGALGDLPDLIGPVHVDGGYDLEIAVDATEGIEKVSREQFDCIIVDIRLPPGDDERWIKIYNHPEKNKDAARLGLLVLRSLLDPPRSEIKVKGISWHIRPEIFGVLTVENQSEVEKDLNELKIAVYHQKNRKPSVTTLLDLIRKVMARSRPAEEVK
jgi:CheY-like chemotaxis protein